MTPFVADSDFTLYQGDCLEVLRALPAQSVHCCVTSPPYWGLRDYGSDGQIGLEATPGEYVARMVDVFREVRRVLRDDGTLWLNLGDSYAAGGMGGHATSDTFHGHNGDRALAGAKKPPPGLKQKDLVGIPWRVAFALQADGWYLRSDIIWSKPNPMPESVTDRPTKSHEYVFLLSKSAQYFFDADAVREPAEWARWGDQTNGKHEGTGSAAGWIGSQSKEDIQAKARGGGFSRKYAEAQPSHGAMRLERPADTGSRNIRSVWEIVTGSYSEAHFATFPLELPRRCIKAGSVTGGVVLDPFIGSGTTALVARDLGRRSIGIELNPDYCALAARRLQQLSLMAAE